MKTIIGLVGENGSGKDTFTTFFKAAAAPLDVKKLRFSDILADTLKRWDIPLTRSNLQNLAIIMDKQYGKGTLTHATEKRIRKDGSDIIVLEGIRWHTDIPMIRKFKNSFIVYVTAEPKIRFKRLKERGEKIGEKDLTFERFKLEEKAATEVDIPEIGSKADFKIENNGSLDEFRRKVEELYKQLRINN